MRLSRPKRYLNKPHYLFRPRQIFARIAYAIRGGRRHPGEIWTTSLPWGLELSFAPSEMIGSSIARTGVYDLVVSEALSRLTDRGDLAVDAGANIGYMSSILALRAGRPGRVLAFEPHPQVCDLLRRNVGRWPDDVLAPVEVREVAVSDRNGHGWLRIDEGFPANMGSAQVALAASEEDEGRRIALVRLDDELQGASVGVLKLDVEGHELHALQGAEAAISDGRLRDVVFESHEGFPSPVTDLLGAAGYRVFALRQSLLGPELAEPGGSGLQGWEPSSYLATLEPERAGTRFRPRGWTVLAKASRLVGSSSS